jgi:hypothetical protein
MDDGLHLVTGTISRILELVTKDRQLVIKHDEYGPVFQLGEHSFHAGGGWINPEDWTRMYAHFTACVAVDDYKASLVASGSSFTLNHGSTNT